MEDASKIFSDMDLVRKYFKVGKLVGTVPFYSASSSGIKKCLSIFYISALTALFASVLVFSVVDRGEMYSKMKLIHIIVDFLVIVVNILFILTCRITPIVKIKTFSLLDETILLLEKNLTDVNFKLTKWNVLSQNIKFCAVHLLFILIHLLELFSRKDKTDNMRYFLMFLPHVIGMYHQLFVINLVTKLNHAVEIRYIFLRKCIASNAGKIDFMETKDNIISLDQIFQISKLMFKLCRMVNDIFGPQIFFILSRTVLETLTIINLLKSDMEWSSIASDLAYGTTFVISTIFIVKSCDNVVNSAMNILQTCYTNQETLKGTLPENKLLRFAKLNKHLIPRYSAGGFADIDQKLLSALFSATLTYLIVIVQFDLSSKS